MGTARKQFDREAAVKRYVETKSSLIVAKEFGVNSSTILKLIKQQGLQTRTGRPRVRAFDEKEAVRLYKELGSSSKVAEKLGTGGDVILRVFKKNGVKIGKPGARSMELPVPIDVITFRYASGESCESIAKGLGVKRHMIAKWLKGSGAVFRSTKAKLDERFFKNINSEEKAYWLGFLSADGNIGQDNAIRLELQERDGLHVLKFANAISMKSEVYRRSNGRTEIGVQPKSVLMVNDLMDKGLAKGTKSQSLVPASISSELERHYWRGLVDGDGSLGLNKGKPVIDLCGTKEICEGFRMFLLNNKIATSATVRPAYRFAVESSETLDVADLLYGGANVFLDRKMAIYRGWKNLTVEYNICKIRPEVADDFLRAYHYLGGSRPGLVNYGLFIGGVLSGVACFGTPSSQFIASSIVDSSMTKRVWELARFALVPTLEKNSASKFLSRALNLLELDNPDIWFVVSYADSAQGHEGIVYLATGAKLLDKGSNELVVVTPNGEKLSGRSSVILANLERRKIDVSSCSLSVSEGKRKYLFVQGSGRQKSQRLKSVKLK